MSVHRCVLSDETEGAELPPLSIPLSRTFIVASAIASRDYQDVHHDPELARRRGSRDIFMNILTSNALAERYVRDWVGPCARIARIRIRLGAPNYPGDEMVLTGSVAESGPATLVEVLGRNALGVHLSGDVEVGCALSRDRPASTY